jgi:aspartyl-tRNA(Asn)/glutamyl-tRNA(Gln) amidotransferase subunit A
MSVISTMTLSEVATAIRRRDLSSTEATSHCLNLIAQRDQNINAFAAIDEERALLQARAADDALASGNVTGLLHGVPLAHKDMFYRFGEESGCGSLIRRGWFAPTTADVLKRLDSTGSVTLGRLNMSEFALGPIGLNYHNRATRNPWNTDHVSGGSSSGPAAAVASGFCFGALGSDTGASIRVPAAACGLVGLKTTLGWISTAGTMPLASSLDVIGPLARSVADVALLTAILAMAADGELTASANPVFLRTDRLVDDRRPKIGIPATYFLDSLDREIEAKYESARAVCLELGFELVSVDTSAFAEAASLYGDILGFEAAAFHSRWLTSRPHDYSPQVRARLQQGQSVTKESYALALTARQALLVRVLSDVFRNCDAVLAPVLSGPVPTVAETDVGNGPRMTEIVSSFLRLTKPVNVLGLPALSLPAGFTQNGLPSGIQLIGAPWSDPRLLAFGRAYEQATTWRKYTPKFGSSGQSNSL